MQRWKHGLVHILSFQIGLWKRIVRAVADSVIFIKSCNVLQLLDWTTVIIAAAKRLKNHMIYHSEKAFKCDTCGKMFYTRPQLRRHQLVHSRTTDFSCPYCSYQCSLAENLRKHCQAIHKVTYPAKKRLNYRREFPKPKQPKETTAHLEETVIRCISLPPVLEMINCSA